jgi:TM2 domain-containing membrane protein YozV
MGTLSGLIVILIVVGVGLFWVTTLIHAIQYEEEYNKVAWVIVIVFMNIIGSLIYVIYRLFLRR